ncbi:MAG: oxygen-dependent coproporphyrinogen oxidase [Acidobacteriota bacterium]
MTTESTAIDIAPMRGFLLDLQDEITTTLATEDGTTSFREDIFERPGGGLSRPRVLDGGELIERAAVNFSHTVGASLPKAGTSRKPELAGAAFEAVSVSLIVHPRNPYIPTSHANIRCFVASRDGVPVAWWFGGGFDLTPYYGFEEDCVHWHRTAHAAVAPYMPAFGDDLYDRLKTWCDDYFLLHHRGEPRGIGGLFYDDFDGPDFASCLGLTQSVGSHFLPAYLPLIQRRKDHPYGERERDFQRYRRGRYVEFNLVWDRGTRFGLELGGRVESILASMPPDASWRYDWRPEPGTPEARLYDDFLRPRDWLNGG